MRRSSLAILLTLLVPAIALGWSGTPILVDGVTEAPARVAVMQDGGFGAFVAWQGPASAAELRVTHLLADGSHDPAWPTGGIQLAAGSTSRVGLKAISDEQGGTYLHWQEGRMLYVTRVLATGAIATGWTARGRALGALTSERHRPWSEADGQGGIWLGWSQGIRSELEVPSVRAIHLNAAGTGANGWPNTSRALPLDPDHLEWVYSASFGIAAEGGLWALVATGRVDEDIPGPGEWRLGRFLANGALDPARPSHGTTLTPYDPTAHLYQVPVIGLGAVGDAGPEGLLVMRSTSEAQSESWRATAATERRLATGELHPAQGSPRVVGFWDEAPVPGACSSPGSCEAGGFSPRLTREPDGSFILAVAQTATHSDGLLQLIRFDAGAEYQSPVVTFEGPDPDYRRRADGTFVGTYIDPMGPGPYNGPPAVAIRWASGVVGALDAEALSPYDVVFSDVDVTPLPDGGAIGVWSRRMGATGLYALRVSASGSPLAVTPSAAGSRGLLLSRRGGRLEARWPAGAPGTLRLLDVQGREHARIEVGDAAGEAMLEPPTGAPGVYFARLVRRDGSRADARAAVLR